MNDLDDLVREFVVAFARHHVTTYGGQSPDITAARRLIAYVDQHKEHTPS